MQKMLPQSFKLKVSKMEGNTIEEIAKANAVSPYKIVAIVSAQ
jgi:hypothetical protein